MKFRDLAVGQEFDFCIAEEVLKRHFMPAVKTGPRKYRVVGAKHAVGEISVRSINTPVFNVKPVQEAADAVS